MYSQEKQKWLQYQEDEMGDAHIQKNQTKSQLLSVQSQWHLLSTQLTIVICNYYRDHTVINSILNIGVMK